MPYTVAKEQNIITIQLKGININSTDSLAYNYFIPSQTLRTFIHYVSEIYQLKYRKIIYFSLD
jgi:hypothetical protein